MIDMGFTGTDANACLQRDLLAAAVEIASRPSIGTNKGSADSQTLPQSARSIRSRKCKRTQRNAGQPLSIELRDGAHVPATLVDESTSGLGVQVAEGSLFHHGQRIAVRRRGVRAMAFVRNIKSEAAGCRLALKMPA
jgi:hypothetical protein